MVQPSTQPTSPGIRGSGWCTSTPAALTDGTSATGSPRATPPVCSGLMDVEELIARAWRAVESAGVPEPLQELAFREAIDLLRQGSPTAGKQQPEDTAKVSGRGTGSGSDWSGGSEKQDNAGDDRAFFSNLATESGVGESDLRDLLLLTDDGLVHVTPPTRSLGSSKAEQARTVVTLVAAARRFGLGERPVNAVAVRTEVERKGSYDKNNFANKVLTPLKGWNAGSNRNEIVDTSKWVPEFVKAVDLAHGRKAAGID